MGSEMCIRDSFTAADVAACGGGCTLGDAGVHRYSVESAESQHRSCLLYTSDAADERSSVDLGGRRIIKKKKNDKHR